MTQFGGEYFLDPREAYSLQAKRTVRKRLSVFLWQAHGGKTAQSVCREQNISEQTHYSWKKKYGDMELADAKRLKELEKEHAEIKKMLENCVLKEVN